MFKYRCQYDKAVEYIVRGAKAESDNPMLKIFRSAVYYYRGDTQMAIDLMGQILDEHPEMDGIRPLYAVYLAGAGRSEDAKAQLTDDALSLSRSDHDMAYWVASSFALLGEKELAFKWLGRAIKLGNENKPHFLKDRSLDSLRDDPRFDEMMSKIGADN